MNEDTKKKEIQRIKDELLDINFCVSCIEINGVKYFTVITNETDLVKNIPEILMIEILKGRKYKIPNLKVVNNRVVLREMYKEPELVKNLDFYLGVLEKMEQPFLEQFMLFLKKKLNLYVKRLYNKYHEKVSFKKEIICDEESCIAYLSFRDKTNFRFGFVLQIVGEKTDYSVSVNVYGLDWHGDVTDEFGYGNLENYNISEIEIWLENTLCQYISHSLFF